jgi:hypothetical protein
MLKSADFCGFRLDAGLAQLVEQRFCKPLIHVHRETIIRAQPILQLSVKLSHLREDRIVVRCLLARKSVS